MLSAGHVYATLRLAIIAYCPVSTKNQCNVENVVDCYHATQNRKDHAQPSNFITDFCPQPYRVQ